jgi:hypothetical protein
MNMQPVQAQPGTVELPLRDIHLPDAISWWPLAPGWWILLACLLVLIIAMTLGRRYYRKRRLNRLLNHEIHDELKTIKAAYEHQHNKIILARQLSELLRRASVSIYAADKPAGLTGDQWLGFLQKTCQQCDAEINFDHDTARVLIEAPYLATDSSIDYDADALLALCETWLLQRHHASGVMA